MNKQPEHELLLAAAKFLTRNGAANYFENIPAGLDWDNITHLAGKHGLSPLLFYALLQSKVTERVPAAALDYLKKSYLLSLARNTYLLRLLKPLIHSFNKNDVPVLLLKGPALCQTIYPEIALRPFGDLDIMVPKNQINAGKTLLEEAGFELITGNYRVPDELNEQLGCEWSYHQKNSIIELHWDLIDKLAPFQIDIESFWRNAIETDIEGERVLIMNPATQLIHLSLHQFKHHWEHLRDLVDIALVSERFENDIEWNGLALDARRQGVDKCVYYTLSITKEVLDSSIKEEGLMQLRKEAKPGKTGEAAILLVSSRIFDTFLPRRLFELLLVRSLKARLKLLKRTFGMPFSREIEKAGSKPVIDQSFISRIKIVMRSIIYYRHITFEFFCSLGRVRRRGM